MEPQSFQYIVSHMPVTAWVALGLFATIALVARRIAKVK